MPKLFTSIHLCEHQKKKFSELIIPEKEAIIQNQPHITLNYIGHVSIDCIPSIISALGKVKHTAFSQEIKGVGEFNRDQRKYYLWARVKPTDHLISLQRKLHHELSKINLTLDEKHYLPHITIATLNQYSPNIIQYFLNKYQYFHTALSIRSFGLYESCINNNSQEYLELMHFPLTP